MPYEKNAELPESVRNVLPAEAQTTFRKIVNNALDQYEGDESRAFATAWSGLRKAGWTKGKDGKWHKQDEDVEKARTSLWAGFWLDPTDAEDLAIQGGEAADQLHITLCYFGKLDELGDDAADTVNRVTAEVAAKHGPMKAKVTGIGRFEATENSDGKDVIYARVEGDELLRFREALVEELEKAGVPPRNDFDGYTPHITLASIEPTTESPIKDTPPMELALGAVQVRVGDEPTGHQLTGTGTEKAKPVEKSFQRTMEIFKVNQDQRLVFGWAKLAYEEDGTQLVDWQNDVIDEENLEKMAYRFVMFYREGGEMHVKGGSAIMVESMVFTKAKLEALGIPEGTLPIGWWIGFYVTDDDAWEGITSGKYKAFSIEGTAVREEVSE